MTSAYPGIALPGLTFPGVIDSAATEPVLTVEISFTSPALTDTPVWTDVTDYVRTVEVRRGRNMELSQFDTGTFSVLLDNNDGRFTPRTSGGVYTLRPKQQIRVKADYFGTTYHLALGNIERWPATITSGDLTVNVPAVDGFRLLNDALLSSSDTGPIVALGPKRYWPLQGTDAGTALLDTVAGQRLSVVWSGSDTLDNIVTAGGTPPDVAYGAESVLSSGNGTSIDMGGYYTFGGLEGSYALSTNLSPITMDTAIGAIGTGFTAAGWTFVPALSHPDGSALTVFACDMDSTTGSPSAWGLLYIMPDGSVRCGISSTVFPAGTIQPATKHQMAVSVLRTTPTDWTYRVQVDGVQAVAHETTRPVGTIYNTLYVGGKSAPLHGGNGGRFAHVAAWDRPLTATELASLWPDSRSGPGLTAKDRISATLDAIGWPASMRDLQAGISPLVRDSWDDNTEALPLMQKWAESDGGALYMGRDGKVVYRNRFDRVLTNPTPVATFDCSGTSGVEGGLEWIMDENDIINVVDVNLNYGPKFKVQDAASVAIYGVKPKSLDLEVQSVAEGTAKAQDILSKYANPFVRLSGVTIYPTAAEDNSLWSAAVNLRIGDLIRLTNLPAASPATTLDYFIESINHSITRDGRLIWAVSFDVSPASLAGPVPWVLGDATRGVLDSTTRIVY